jgi:flagellar assembly factor FliW
MNEARGLTVRTVNFGEIEIPEEKIIHFKEGIPGFPQIRKFAMLEMENLKPFNYLQSLEDPPIALLVVNPFLLQSSYQFEVSEKDAEDLQTGKPEEISIFAVATIPEDPSNATVNLMAPILINDRNRCGKQIILLESRYSVRHPLFRAAAKNGVEPK